MDHVSVTFRRQNGHFNLKTEWSSLQFQRRWIRNFITNQHKDHGLYS
jgi:hypothetical protein